MIERQSFDLSQLLIDLIEEIRIIASADGIAVEGSIASNLRISNDQTKIREVVMNLVSNAIKYIGEETEPKITISLHENAEITKITVTDNGVGMEKNEVERIFENFYRSESASTQKGTGLGLAITQQIVTRLGGSITVDSRPTVGSTFTVSLPK